MNWLLALLYTAHLLVLFITFRPVIAKVIAKRKLVSSLVSLLFFLSLKHIIPFVYHLLLHRWEQVPIHAQSNRNIAMVRQLLNNVFCQI